MEPRHLLSTTAEPLAAGVVPPAAVAMQAAAPAIHDPGDPSAAQQAAGPRVTGVQRLGFHARPTRLVVGFSEPLDPIRAGDGGNYALFAPGPDRGTGTRDDVPVPIRSATYDPATRSVTLRPAAPLRLLGGARYLLRVDGTAPGGVVGANGQPLDGNVGDDFVGTFGAQEFVPSPELVRALQRIRRAQLHRDGTGRLR